MLAATLGLRSRVRANRAFLARAVRYLAADAGIRQFLDIGTGIPAANNTHEVAQAVVPDARIVYLDNDQCKSVVHTVQIWSGCVHRTGSKAESPGQVLRAWRSRGLLESDCRAWLEGSAAVMARILGG